MFQNLELDSDQDLDLDLEADPRANTAGIVQGSSIKRRSTLLLRAVVHRS